MANNDIVFVEYNGANRPHQVFTRDLTGYDFFYKYGYIQCEWCSGGINPFLSELCPEWKLKNKLKVWFNEDFRPNKNSLKEAHILSDAEIKGMGYVKIGKPLHLDEICDAINDC